MRKLASPSSLALLLVTGLAASACGASTPPPAPARPPLTQEQAKSFERGVDFVATLEGIEGRWRDDWDKDLAVRVGNADLIALVTVRTLRTDTDPEQRVTHRVIARVDRELVGRAEGELELPVHAEDLGFTSVNDNLNRLNDKQFIAYVRRGATGIHWHLSPASDQVMLETESKITELQRMNNQGDQRVVVHTD